MSTAIFPTLAGQGWTVKRSEIWKSRRQENVSGKEVRLADWSYPRHRWNVQFEFLRQAGSNQQVTTFMGSAYGEMMQMAAFFDNRSGAFDSFLYLDPDDNTITGQVIGTGNGSTTAFQLSRQINVGANGYQEPIFAPNLTATRNVYINNVLQGGGTYTINPWGTSDANGPGAVVFNSAPGNGLAIKVDFSWYFPVHFDNDQMDFEKFMSALYQSQDVSFSSIK